MKNSLLYFYACFGIVACITFTPAAFGAGSGYIKLEKADFPKTINDVPFEQRVKNQAAGYAPFKDAVAYVPIKLQYTEEELDQIIEEMQPFIDTLAEQRDEDEAQMTNEEYCKKYPLEKKCNPSAEEISNAFNAPVPNTPAPTAQPRNNTVVARNNVHDGPCTPHSATPPFEAKIYTSGAHASAPAFNKAMNTIFRAEGGCARERKSINSITCYGLTQRYNPEINVRTITRAQAEDHTYKKYYRGMDVHKLPDAVRGEVLHVNFWTGSYGARLLRRLLNVNPNKKSPNIESELVTAADNYRGHLFNDYMDLVDQHMTAVAQRIYTKEGMDYRRGFKRRVQLMRENGCHVTPIKPYS